MCDCRGAQREAGVAGRLTDLAERVASGERRHSYSSLSTYAYCPAQWRLKHVDRAQREAVDDTERQVGVVVHDAYEKVLRSLAGSRAARAEAAFDEACDANSVSDAVREKAHGMFGRLLAMRDVEQVEGWPEYEVGGEVGGVALTGRIDLLVENEDGSLTVEDLKTGKPPSPAVGDDGDGVAPGYVEPKRARQLVMYAEMLESQNPDVRVRNVRLVYPQAAMEVEVSLSGERGRYYRQEMRNFVTGVSERLEESLATGEFPAKPTPKKCGRCEFAGSCSDRAEDG